MAKTIIDPSLETRTTRVFHNSFPDHGKVKMTDGLREVAELKKSLREAKMETEILKKAINIFSTSDRKSQA